MHLKEAGTPWLLHYDSNCMVDFCLWVLTKDGMQIHPFGAHPPGDHSLSLRGMYPQEWLEWLVKVVHLQEQPEPIIPGSLQNLSGTSPLTLPAAFDPVGMWEGNFQVKQRLQELWDEYQPLMSARKKWMRSLAAQLRDAGQQIWRDLQPYRTHIPSLTIHFVTYSQQVALLVSPVSMIITVVNNSVDSGQLRQLVLQQVEKSL